MEWINQARELFGDKLAVLFIFGTLAWVVLAFSPFLVPAWRAFSKRDRLPRPLVFVLVVGGLSYGWTEFVVTLVSVPFAVFLIFIAPTLREAELLQNSWLLTALDGFVKWWWLGMPVAFVTMAVVVTKLLGRRWRQICKSLAT